LKKTWTNRIRAARTGVVCGAGLCKAAGLEENLLLPPAWSLHPQLEKDTINIGDLPLSRVLVINDANYPGCCWRRAAPA